MIDQIIDLVLKLKIIVKIESALRCYSKMFCHITASMYQYRPPAQPTLHNNERKTFVLWRLAQCQCSAISIIFILNRYEPKIVHLSFKSSRNIHFSAANKNQFKIVFISLLVFLKIPDQCVNIFSHIFSPGIKNKRILYIELCSKSFNIISQRNIQPQPRRT